MSACGRDRSPATTCAAGRRSRSGGSQNMPVSYQPEQAKGEKPVMRRRTFLATAAAAGALTSVGGLMARAADRPFTFTSWGGALSDAEKAAFTDPFAASKGIQIVNASPTETAKIKAMVQSGNVEWDLVDVGGRTVWQGGKEGFLEQLDLSKIPNAANLEKGWVSPYGIATSTGASIMAWSTTAFPDGGPQSWADFWDVKRFP